MSVGQIEEYRVVSLEELRELFGQQCRDAQALDKLEAKPRETSAGKFADALGCLEDGIYLLGCVDNGMSPVHDIRLVAYYGLRPSDPETRFWEEIYEAIHVLKGTLQKLQRVEPLAPKEVTCKKS